MAHEPSSLPDGHETTLVVLDGQVKLETPLVAMQIDPSGSAQYTVPPPPELPLLLPKPLLLPPIEELLHWLLHDCWQLAWLTFAAHCVHCCVSAFGMQPFKHD